MKWQDTARLFARGGAQTRESISKHLGITYSQAIRRVDTLESMGVLIGRDLVGDNKGTICYKVVSWGPINGDWFKEN